MEPLKKKMKCLYKVSFLRESTNNMEEVKKAPLHMNVDAQKVLAKWLFDGLKLFAVQSSFDTRYMPAWLLNPEKLAYARVSRNTNDFKAHLDGVPARTDLRLAANALAFARVGRVWKVAFDAWKQREVELAIEAFHHRAAKLAVRMCGRCAYDICDDVPPKSCLDMVLSLHGRDVRELRFVRFRKGDKTQHLIEAFRRRSSPFSTPTYKTEVPTDCWVPDYELTMPRMDAVEMWENSQVETLVVWLGNEYDTVNAGHGFEKKKGCRQRKAGRKSSSSSSDDDDDEEAEIVDGIVDLDPETVEKARKRMQLRIHGR